MNLLHYGSAKEMELVNLIQAHLLVPGNVNPVARSIILQRCINWIQEEFLNPDKPLQSFINRKEYLFLHKKRKELFSKFTVHSEKRKKR